jgi:midasin
VRPHPHFMLFATQNPAGAYAGRKALSRAFRSRFLELHVDDIPDAELATILERRTAIAPSYASKLVAAMRELQRRRQVEGRRNSFARPPFCVLLRWLWEGLGCWLPGVIGGLRGITWGLRSCAILK